MHGWRRGDEALRAAAREGRARPRDLRWLPLEVVSVATAIGQEEIGLGDEVDALAMSQHFRERYPSAGSFWDVHGTEVQMMRSSATRTRSGTNLPWRSPPASRREGRRSG